MHKVRAAVGFGGRPALRQDLPPGPTAGYGKPYVRWCGRVPGRNPRYPTRSIAITVAPTPIVPLHARRKVWLGFSSKWGYKFFLLST